jgi:pyridoxal/pyridoxine/pyridoxamine kinase
MEYLMDSDRDMADFEQFLKSKEGKASKLSNFGLLENTIEERVTFLYRFQARKHGVGDYLDEDEYVESELKQLTRTEFLERISNAIEERLKEIK